MGIDTRLGRRAARVLAPAGVAAALLAGSMIYAGAASADTPTAPTITLTAPPRISNDQQTQTLSITIDNSATGTAQIPATDELQIAFTAPAGLACSDITLAAQGTAPDLGTVSGTGTACSAEAPLGTAIAADAPAVPFKYTLTVNGVVNNVPTTTGTLTAIASIIIPGATPTTLQSSPPTSTDVINPIAPEFTATPAATVHVAYNEPLVTQPGFANGSTSYAVYSRVTGAGNAEMCTPLTQHTATNGDPYVDLNDGLVLDLTTGSITASAATLNHTDSTPPTYVIVANNGVGGAATGTAATTTSCPAVAVNDVQRTFSVPVLFGDTAVDSLFGPAIYTLADNGVINGYGDGNFHGQWAVTRDQFAHYIAVYEVPSFVDGACTLASPSQFTDVPNSSLFCKSIKLLASTGVVNGYGDGTFGPGRGILRQEMSAYLYRVHEVATTHVPAGSVVDAPCTSPTGFTDVTTGNLFCGDIEWLEANSITAGYGDGTFRPKNGVARQEAAQFIYNLGGFEHHVY